MARTLMASVAGTFVTLAAVWAAPSAYDARGRTPNWEYLSSLPGFTDMRSTSRHQVQQLDAADPWNATGIKGVHYNPSYTMNSIMTWVNFDAAVVTKELGFASAASATHVRIALNWIPWAVDATGFLANLEQTVSTASGLGMKTIFQVFDGTGCCDPTPAWVTNGQYNSTGWVSTPGDAMVNNASSWSVLEAYVDALTAKYGRDARVAGWDVMYQPIVELPSQGGYYNFLEHFSQRIIGAVDASVAFTTISIIPGAEVCDSARVPTQYVNVLSFENYNGNLGAIGGDTIGVQDCASSLAAQHGGVVPPVILSGTMDRNAEPTQTLCDCRFEAYGEPWIDIPSHPPVGLIITNLMIGADGSSWGPPSQPPNQGLVYPNGTWYDEQERACFEAAVPGPPPPPPGPPASIVNFTAGGLAVGLRPVSRAIQVLGIHNDSRWFFNFSFVPPLWNFLPPQPHRDFAGCHHVGDLILRVQPASVTDPTSWAFYSSAQGAAEVPVTPLNSSDPSVYDASDITPALTASGQTDTRYSLGLSVARYFEQAPGGAAKGFRMRFAVTNTNASAIRIGSLGIPLLTNTNFGGLNLTQVAAFGSFLEGYPGGDRSFATMTRADGSDTAIIWPCEAQPGAGVTSGMEAWRPVLEDGSDTAGGVYAWEVVSGAFEAEWNVNTQAPAYLSMPNDPAHQAAWPNPRSPTPSWHLNETLWSPTPRQWNPQTTLTIQPGETQQFALCFALARANGSTDAVHATSVGEKRAAIAAALTQVTAASASAPPPPSTKPGPRQRDAALARAGQPVLLPVPGYVISTEMSNATLTVLPPWGASLQSAVSNDLGVLAVASVVSVPGPVANLTTVSLTGLSRGRARIVLTYTDGTWQSVNYYVLLPLRDHIATYGVHASTVAWLPRDFVDPFGRSASVMPWDREDGVHVLQDGRPFVVGLSDDAGASPNLGLASRVAIAPTVLQASRLDDYIFWTLMGVKNDTAMPPLFSLQDPTNDRIRMTLWYFDNPLLNTTSYYEETDKCTLYPSWCSFNSPYPGYNPKDWIAEYRQYNFPHQISVYYALYRVARDWDGVAAAAGLRQTWDWYLTRAVETLVTVACPDENSGRLTCIPSVGLMDGTVFREVLEAVAVEAAAGSPSPGPYTWAQWAANVTTIMQTRVYGDSDAPPGNENGWVDADFPYGSEFNWDTTGQEGEATVTLCCI